MRRTSALTIALAALTFTGLGLETLVHSQTTRPGQIAPEMPARDVPSQRRATQQPGTGRISGRVVAADTGRPLPRARIAISSSSNGVSLTAMTDTEGLFDFMELQPGRYNLTVHRSGYVTLQYGQRRPLLPGTPLQLAEGQHLSAIELRLPRGSVISGLVFDELGDPIAGAMVQVLRYQYAQGQRRLFPAGTGQTDDRGQYRIWGLMPGEYFVSAMVRPAFNLAVNMAVQSSDVVALAGVAAAMGGRGGRGGGRANVAPGAAADSDDQTAYAPTYYPGVSAPGDARAVTVGLSAEVLDVNFNVLLVRTARITGRVLSPDGSAPRGGNVNLTLDGGAGRPTPGTAFGAGIQADGSFVMNNVPPGRYILRARSNTARRENAPGNNAGGRGGADRGGRGRGDNRELLYATMPVVVSSDDVEGLVIALAPGATISGTIALEGSTPDSSVRFEQFRVMMSAVDEVMGPNGNTRTDTEGRFTLDNVPAGAHQVRVNGGRGWTVKSIMLGAQDVTDTPFQINGGETLSGMRVVLTNRLTEINGAVTDGRGTPVADYTVLAFSEDPSRWRPQSRHIATVRPDQTGAYQLRGLPPGSYYITTIDPIEQGEWFDPEFLEAQRPRSQRITIGEGETEGLNLTIE